MPTVQTDHQTFYYELYGPEAGEPLLLLHGYMDIGRDMAIVAGALAAEGFRVVVPDLPGYGRSVPPNRTFPPDFYVRDARLIGDLLDALGLDRVHIMGFSDGGEVALLLPILRPERCRSCIAWGAIGAYPAALGAWVLNEMPRYAPSAAQRARHPGQDIGGWQEAWIAAFGAIVAAGGDVSRSRAAEIRCPLLLLIGDQDELNPVESVQAFAEAASDPACQPKKVIVFNETGHRIHEERVDRFLEKVMAFLRSVG